MKVPIHVKSISKNPDGTANVELEFDDIVKRALMKAWGTTEWDNARANKEFSKIIIEQLGEEKA